MDPYPIRLVFLQNVEIWANIHSGRMPWKREGKNQGDVSPSQEQPRLPANYQKLGEGHGTYIPSQL